MSTFSQIPGALDIEGIVGDFLQLALEFPSVDLTGYTFECKVFIDNSPLKRTYDISVTEVDLSAGQITLYLSTDDTKSIGEISGKNWYLTWTSAGGLPRTVLSGNFQLTER